MNDIDYEVFKKMRCDSATCSYHTKTFIWRTVCSSSLSSTYQVVLHRDTKKHKKNSDNKACVPASYDANYGENELSDDVVSVMIIILIRAQLIPTCNAENLKLMT